MKMTTAKGWGPVLVVTIAGVLAAQPAHSERALVAGLPAIDSSVGSYAVQPGVSGNLAIAGSDTLQPIMVKLATAFKDWQPGVKTVVQGGGSDTAITGFISDQATIRRGDAQQKGHIVSGHVPLLASSRQLTEAERRAFRSRHGYDPTEMPIALDAIGIYVNHENPIRGLTMAQVDAIFGTDRKRGFSQAVTKWGDLGLEQGWNQQPINLHGRDKRSGTRTFFNHEALLDGRMHPEVKEATGSAMEIVEISRDPLGIGYAGIGFQASTVRVVPLATEPGMPFVAPTAESVTDGSYPLARYLYLYVDKPSNRDLSPDVLAFLKFLNSREGQEIIARSGVYPLPAARIAKNIEILNGSLLSALQAGSK